MPRVIVDNREMQSEVPRYLEEMNVQVESRLLEVGDYVVSDSIAVERKSTHDFISSIYDGRLFRQVDELSRHYANPIILVEGDPSSMDLMVGNIKVYYGALASLIVNFGARTVFVPDQEHTAIFLERLAEKASEEGGGRRELYIPKRVRGSDAAEMQLYIVASAPGIGPKLADRLLREFGSPATVFAAAEGRLAKVIGGKRARRLRQILDMRYEDALMEGGVQSHLD